MRDMFQGTGYRVQGTVVCILALVFCLLASAASADIIYLKKGTTLKGLAVEEYYDRYVFSTEDGEKEIPKTDIDEIFFDEPYQNNLYLGEKFERQNDFEKALKFYRLALESNPNYKDAQDSIKGLEDAKWRFQKRWSYRELKEMLGAQLGIAIKDKSGRIVVSRVPQDDSPLLKNDIIISCWGKPLSHAGLKNASRILIGLSNTFAKLTVERLIRIDVPSVITLAPSFIIAMDYDGPTVKDIKEDSPAYRSGLRAGDLVVRMNGASTRYMKLSEIKRRLFGRRGEKELAVWRGLTVMRKRSENSSLAPKRAMWMWHTKEILLNDSRKAEFLAFCGRKNIGLVFLQLQYQIVPFKGERLCKLLYETKLRGLLKEIHSKGIKVYALDGSPAFCLEKDHDIVTSELKAILKFNSGGPPAERYDGVHYDNEPYILAGFNTPLKEDILRQLLELNQKCRKVIDESGSKLEYGIDVPFWFDRLNSLDKKLTDLCDDIGIMDYRNFAEGPDGMVANALPVLKYASSMGKKVYIGVETSEYPKEEAWFVSILPEEQFDKQMQEKGPNGQAGESRFEEFGLKVQIADKKAYIGLVKPEAASPGSARENEFNKALSRLRDQFGAVLKPQDKGQYDQLILDTQYGLSQDPELRDMEPQERTAEDGRVYMIFRVKNVILEKLTFAQESEKEMESVLAEAQKELKNYPAFAGFAIHHYKSYRELSEKK